MAIRFDGSTGYLSLGSAPVTAQPLTIAGWVRPFAKTGTPTLWAIENSANTTDYFSTFLEASSLEFLLQDRTGATTRNARTQPAAHNGWCHVAQVEISGSNHIIYLNGGANVSSSAASSVPSGLNIATIGGFTGSGAMVEPFFGEMAEFAIWNTNLTLGEVGLLAQGVPPREVRPGKLAAYLSFVDHPSLDATGRVWTVNGGVQMVQHPVHLMPRQLSRGWRLPRRLRKPSNAYSLAMANGSFGLTGEAAALAAARKAAIANGSFVLTGEAARLSRDYTRAEAVGSFGLTGEAAALTAARKLALANGSFTLTGEAASVKAARVLALGAGSFSFTGESVTLDKGVTMSGGAGNFSLTGQAAAFAVTHVMAASAGSIALTGESAGLIAGHALVASVGSIAVTGEAAGLVRGRVLAAGAGAFALDGEDAILASSYLLAAQPGSFELAGEDAAFARSRGLAAIAGFFSLLGQSIVMRIFRIDPVFVIEADTRVREVTAFDSLRAVAADAALREVVARSTP